MAKCYIFSPLILALLSLKVKHFSAFDGFWCLRRFGSENGENGQRTDQNELK